jgi:lipid II:glycine glycyltransferase (peptidoglycan interpeptide bridge formation enzyme)
MAYVPRGPVVNWENANHVAALMDAVAHAARRQRAWALWLDAALLDTPEAHAQLRNLGFTPAGRVIQPPRTIVIDISVNEEEILARMKQKTRYNIRLSARRGVTVREGSVDEVATFYALMTETGSRDEFGIHSEAYYRRALELFSRAQQNPTSQPHIGGEAALLLADVEGETVAGLMVFALGQKAWYFYGASSNRHRSTMPTYALQWAAIRWAKARGCTRYDLWGIPDADEETLEAEFTERSDGLWGVYRFKRGFGGEVVRYVGLWEKALNPLYPFVARLGPYGRSHS